MILSIANIFRSIARFGIIILGFTMISISIFTGALKYGITFDNILRNLPEALPWFLVLFTLLLAWEYEILGGIILFLLGIFGIYYFHATAHSTMVLIYMMWAVLTFGAFFIISGLLHNFHRLSYS